jgi:hypothetical protein
VNAPVFEQSEDWTICFHSSGGELGCAACWYGATQRANAENERLRAALRQLAEWDMLSLRADGHGAATADAPWARALIAAALDSGEGES